MKGRKRKKEAAKKKKISVTLFNSKNPEMEERVLKKKKQTGNETEKV